MTYIQKKTLWIVTTGITQNFVKIEIANVAFCRWKKKVSATCYQPLVTSVNNNSKTPIF